MSDPIFSRDVRAIGKSTASLERAARVGGLHRIRPGAYADSSSWSDSGARERHILKIRAVERIHSGRPVFSHESAAALWEIPIVGEWPEFVAVSFDGRSGKAPRHGVLYHRARLQPGSVVEHGSLRVTSLEKTAIDIARSSSLERGEVSLDHVFR